jgi:hypothetical protein
MGANPRREDQQNREQENELTFNLFPFHLEGLARLLSLAL